MFCDKLRFLREHQELTQSEVAKKLKLTHAYCRYEMAGTPLTQSF